MTEPKDYQVEAALKVWNHQVSINSWEVDMVERMRSSLQAALSAKEPEIPMTRDMLIAAGIATHENISSDFDIYYAALYRAMHKARPKESGGPAACAAGVSDEAVKAFIGAGGFYQRGKSVDQCAREGLTAALPYLMRHKAGSTPYPEKYHRFDGRYSGYVENERSGKDRRVGKETCRFADNGDLVEYTRNGVSWLPALRKSQRREPQGT